MGARKGDLVRARGSGPDRPVVEGILNLRYRKAWNRVLVDVLTATGPVSIDPDSVEVIEAGKMSPLKLDSLDPLSWEDGVISVLDLDKAVAEGLVQPEPRRSAPPAKTT